ncbi:MAG: CHASE2 domain-containing protein, partial [Chloroflexota bacterium]
LAAYFSYFNLSPTLAPQAVSVEENRLTLPATPPLTLTINERGLWMMNYFGDPSTRSGGTFQVYSIRDVIEGDYASAAFDGKIVLVGLMDAVGAVDQRITPVSLNGELMAGVEINANAVETMLSGVPLRPESRTSQALTIAVVAVALSLLLAQVRWQTMMILAAGAPFYGWSTPR